MMFLFENMRQARRMNEDVEKILKSANTTGYWEPDLGQTHLIFSMASEPVLCKPKS